MYDLNSVREELLGMADSKYREFQLKLLPGTDNFIGVRLPKLRRLAKNIIRENGTGYLESALINNSKDEWFEEIMLQGMMIGYMKEDISDIFSYAERFVPKIQNWSVCDSFCSGFKHAVSYREEVWIWLKKYLKSEQEFEARFGIVMLLNYYVDSVYIDYLFPIFDTIQAKGYYAKMAVAWAVSICYIKYPAETMHYLCNNRLDDFTYNKALQKIMESNCVSKYDKENIRRMKRNTCT